MGFFGSIKNNLTQGGVDVKLNAPMSVPFDQPTLTVEVTVVAKDKPAAVKNVRVDLIRETRNQAMGGGSVNSADNTETVARAENTTSFNLAAGESRVIPLTITLNAGQAVSQQLGDDLALQQIAGALGKLQTVANAMNHNSYEYYLDGVADVEGVAFDPNDRREIQLLKPGEAATGFNLSL